MMVEIISPGIMYNGLPWPEEEFMKVTIEIDLPITRLLTRHPINWTLLSMLAQARPALCYCSVLVRAVVAISISYWASLITSRLCDHLAQVDSTRKVLELMAGGYILLGFLIVFQPAISTQNNLPHKFQTKMLA
jgi:integrator complex subunit 5